MGSPGLDGGDATPNAPESLSRPPSELSSQLPDTSLKEGASSTISGISALPAATTTTNNSTNGNLNKMSHSSVGSPVAQSASHTPLPEDAPQSHPMTASNSVSSHQDNDKSGQSQNAPPQAYGTRSRRNRPGTGRPNYAEDHDVEMEYEQTGRANGTARDSAASDSQTVATRQSPSPAAASQKRVTSGAATNGWSAVNNNSSNNSNSPIPGTSTFSANPNVNVPKKRKAGGAPQNSASSHGNLVQTAQTNSVSRRANASSAATATTGARDARQNGLYSFSKTKAKLQNGNLVADDGTVFSVNGELCSFVILSLLNSRVSGLVL
jgi:hypothetical protein